LVFDTTGLRLTTANLASNGGSGCRCDVLARSTANLVPDGCASNGSKNAASGVTRCGGSLNSDLFAALLVNGDHVGLDVDDISIILSHNRIAYQEDASNKIFHMNFHLKKRDDSFNDSHKNDHLT
jgi:hypothetical protein